MSRAFGPVEPWEQEVLGYGERLPTGSRADVPDPATGGPLIVAGLLTGFGAVIPWAHIPSLSLSPTGVGMGLGWAYVFSAILALVAGGFVLARRGTAAAVLALVVGALEFIFSVLAAASIPVDQAALHNLTPTDVSIGAGLWLAMGGTALTLLAASLALARRNTEPAGR
ncbi:MAG TPA: hypothetical protein VGN18_14820 [Jatrophihabitans sp.]|jgi:hypothetical protein|uniref:hypothetical protein n=1 Tax=Jatrophihabitans sp. TaxID=1932789 RepID=UPI002DF964DF|nr:hypothetical protein [Jatrophihabitans sp.]